MTQFFFPLSKRPTFKPHHNNSTDRCCQRRNQAGHESQTQLSISHQWGVGGGKSGIALNHTTQHNILKAIKTCMQQTNLQIQLSQKQKHIPALERTPLL